MDIEEKVTKEGYHRSENLGSDDRVIIMLNGTGGRKKIRERATWLEWWVVQLEQVTKRWGRITALISSSKEYDAWIKFVANQWK